MSIFFEGEARSPRAAEPNPTVEDYEAALPLLSKPDRDTGSRLRALGLLGREKVERLYHQCRKAEAALLAAVAAGSVTTKAQAVMCVQEATDGKFPAAKFIAVYQERIGTWTQVMASAREEIG